MVPLPGCEGWVLGAIERGISGYKKYDQGNGKCGLLRAGREINMEDVKKG